MAAEIIGRDEELGLVAAFLDEVEQGPAALVLSGEAGIGKTILWETGVEEARGRFSCVLSHRSVEAEATLAFAGLSELLSPVLEELLPSLAPPRRRALEVALWLTEPGERPPEPAAIGVALFDMLRLLAEPGPVLVALDDVQWLDSSTALVVPLALRRLREERVGLFGTLRLAAETPVPFELARSFPEDRLSQISVGPLNMSVLHHLLEQRLGLELTRPELARVQEATAGNPFFALELGRELVRTGTRPAPGQPLRVPDSLRELLGGRLGRLPGETLDVLLQVAALARPTVEVVAAAHGNRERVLRALEAAVREGVVELDDSRVRFSHPLLVSICYEEAPVWKRRAVHRALAEVMGDVEERARHLALASEGPDAAVASSLEAAGGQAAARGATAAAAELYELAAELTLDDPPLARQRRLQSANFHRLAGESDRAGVMLDQLLAEVPSGIERADVLFALASTFRTNSAEMSELFEEALAQAVGDDARSARILGLRSIFHLLAVDVRAALADAHAALERAERVGDPALLAAAIARVGHAETWGGEITPGLLERGAELEQRLGLELEFTESPGVWLGRQLMRLGEIDRPHAIFEALEAKAAARGDGVTRTLLLWYRSLLDWYAGRWQRALEFAAAASELGGLSQFAHNLAWVGRVRGLLEADLGLVDEARASANDALEASRGDEIFTISSLGVLGRLELELGNVESAADYLRELPGRLLAGGVNDPAHPVWPDTIETLVALAELEQAGAYLKQYELHARQFGNPWAIAAAARCSGLLLAAQGDLDGSFHAFERGLAELDAYPYPLERGRTLLCLGVVRRQAGQKKPAREALEKALAIFDELGARLWAEKARGELKRISGRRGASEELTETELRVAELAARGRSNKEIAAELFMGVSTVEMHLSRVYRKLHVRRAGLATRLARTDETADV